jgi:Cyclin, N-terminal domain/Cyclin, C-terminal domain
MTERSFGYSPANAPEPRPVSSELLRDQIRALLKQELKYHRVVAASSRCGDAERGHSPVQEWRRSISQWAFRVIDHFRLDRDIVAQGLMILERFLVSYEPLGCGSLPRSPHSPSRGFTIAESAVDSATYQLAAMSCVYLAVKLHVDTGSEEDYARRKHFRVQTLCQLSRGMFTVKDVSEMELTILRTLGWRVAGAPTPMTFVNYFLQLLPEYHRDPRVDMPMACRRQHDLVVHVLRELSRYLTELIVSIGRDCVQYLPSQIAFASIHVSMELLTHAALPELVRDRFSRRILSMCPWKEIGFRAIDEITIALKKTLWPDMLLDAGERAVDPGHPISLARECGILNLAHAMGRYEESCTGSVCHSSASQSARSLVSTPSTPDKSLTRRSKPVGSWDESSSGSGSPIGVERLAQHLV